MNFELTKNGYILPHAGHTTIAVSFDDDAAIEDGDLFVVVAPAPVEGYETWRWTSEGYSPPTNSRLFDFAEYEDVERLGL